jgi:hypothetical protein
MVPLSMSTYAPARRGGEATALTQASATAFGPSFRYAGRDCGDERRPPGNHQHPPRFSQGLLELAPSVFRFDLPSSFVQQMIGLARRD